MDPPDPLDDARGLAAVARLVYRVRCRAADRGVAGAAAAAERLVPLGHALAASVEAAEQASPGSARADALAAVARLGEQLELGPTEEIADVLAAAAAGVPDGRSRERSFAPLIAVTRLLHRARQRDAIFGVLPAAAAVERIVLLERAVVDAVERVEASDGEEQVRARVHLAQVVRRLGADIDPRWEGLQGVVSVAIAGARGDAPPRRPGS